MNSLRKISMAVIAAGISLAATGVIAQDTATESTGKGKGQRGERGGRRGEMLKGISEADRAKVRELMESMRGEMQTLMQSDIENKRDKMKEIAQKYEPQIKAIVGEENFKKMQAMRQQHMKNRDGKGGKGGKGGRGGMFQNLSEEQKTKLKELHQAMKKDVEAIRAKYEPQIKAIVGAEAFEKMKAMRQNRNGKGDKGGKGGKGGPRGRRPFGGDQTEDKE